MKNAAAAATASQATLLICAPSSRPASFDAIEKALKDWKTAELAVATDFEAATKTAAAREGQSVFILAAVSANQDLVQLVKMLTALRPRLEKREVAVICLNQFNHPKVPVILKSQGCAEILSYECHVKLLARKVSMGVEALIRAKLQPNKDHRGGFGLGSPIGRKNAQASKEAVFVEPLTTPSDCWIIDENKPIRCVMGRWSVALLGPGPSAGEWQTIELKGGDGMAWQWVPRAENGKNPYVSETGRWVYEGREPEFDWKVNVWRIVSQKPIFYFLYDDGTAQMRIQTTPTGMQIARNSKAAIEKRPLIMQSIELSMRIRQAEIASGSILEAREEKGEAKAAPEIQLDPDLERAWNNAAKKPHSPDEPAGDWGGQFAQDAARAGPNIGDIKPSARGTPAGKDGDLKPDAPPPDWNRGDIRHDPMNGGRGLGQGQGGAKGYFYDDDFKSGADAFKQIAMQIELPDYSARGEIVEMDTGYFLLEVIPLSPLESGQEVRLTMMVVEKTKEETKSASNLVEIKPRILEVENIEDTCQLVKLETPPELYEKVKHLFETFQKRQEEAAQFMTLAKGY